MLLTIKYEHAAMEKITEFVVKYVSLKQSCLNYMKNTCNIMYML